jgi:hypothetical protein
MEPRDIRSFAERDWASVARAKLGYWLELTQSQGPDASLRAADALREHVSKHAGDDDDARRAEDFAHHVALKRRIDAASRRLGR